MWTRPSSLTRRTVAARSVATRLSAIVLAVCVLVGTVRSGSRYFYCPTMHMVMDAPCCGGDRPTLDEQEPSALEARSRDCCEEHRLGTLPPGGIATSPDPLNAPLLGVLPAVAVHHRAQSWAPEERFEHQNRAGPKASARHRAELMVFLN